MKRLGNDYFIQMFLAFFICMSLMTAALLTGCEKTVTNIDFIAYSEDITGIELKDICSNDMGEVRTSSSEEFAYIRLTLNDESVDILKERLQVAGREPIQGPNEFNRDIRGDEYATKIKDKIKNETIQAWYPFFKSGKGNEITGKAMTRPIEMIITNDSDGNGFVYLIG